MRRVLVSAALLVLPLAEAVAQEKRGCTKTFTAPGTRWKPTQVAMSPDGSWLATGGHELIARLWDTRRVTPRRTLKGHTNLVRAVAFHPEGRWLATAVDRQLTVWDPLSGEKNAEVEVDKGPERYLADCAYTPDGTGLACLLTHNLVPSWVSMKRRARATSLSCLRSTPSPRT